MTCGLILFSLLFFLLFFTHTDPACNGEKKGHYALRS